MPTHSKRNRRPAPIRQQPRYDPQRKANEPAEMVDMVDPTWVLKAVGGLLVLALLCAFVTVSILFWRAQWQLVLHPSRSVASTPEAIHLPFKQVQFDVDAAGRPQIYGWWIPAAANAPTALVLHSGDGSISNALDSAQLLHGSNLNVLLFEYRGYGQSGGGHPTEASMREDADAALKYLTSTRSIPISSIVVYGMGAGGSLAVHLAAQHPSIPALILLSPDGDFAARARHDPRSSLVPFSLLFNQDFALAGPLHRLKTPVLLLSGHETALAEQQAIVSFVQEYVHSPAHR